MKVKVMRLTPGVYNELVLVQYNDPSYQKPLVFEVHQDYLEPTTKIHIYLIEETLLHADAFVGFHIGHEEWN